MRAYRYSAIITKSMLLQGKITFTDKREGVGVMALPLDSRCITGFILGESSTDAEVNALKELHRHYKAEQGYAVPKQCRVEECAETIVEVLC